VLPSNAPFTADSSIHEMVFIKRSISSFEKKSYFKQPVNQNVEDGTHQISFKNK
jgi:hypothetical protein